MDRFVAALLLGILLVALTACGSSSDPADEDTSSTPAATRAEQPDRTDVRP